VLTPTAEQIRTLAPDASAARAGEGLADPRRWSALGRTETAAWGLCQGSGSSPYQTSVDLSGPAYRCSCPSRKIPCKHALGLLFLVADGKVPAASPADWAASWLESRVTRAEAAATRPDRAPADPAAQAKRVEARERKVAAGIDELDRWLADLVRRGLDGARSEGYRFWDAMAARLVDAQAAGLGRSVRGLGAAAGAGEAWPHLLLEGTARLHLLAEAYRHLADLPEPLRADVRSLVGWTTKEEALDDGDSIADRWLVVGRRVDDTGQVITARTFLLGEASGRAALHLAFGVDAAPPTVLAVPGQAFRATLTFYPSATPLRAVVRPMLVPDGEVATIASALAIPELLRAHAERLAANPFLDGWPVAVRDVVPVVRGDDLLVRDDAGTALPVVPAWLAPRLLAVSRGRPVTLAGEWDGSVLRALGVLADGRLVGLDAADGGYGASRARDGDPAWAGLVSAALLGTERTGETVPIPERVAPLVAERDRERAVLAAAGILALRRRSGRRPAADPDPLPSPAPDDPRPALRGPAARLFQLVVSEARSLLPEAIALVRASGCRFPEETLPDLLTVGTRDDAVRLAVEELAGPLAGWLASHVPDLAAGLAPPLGDDWDAARDAARGGRERAALARSMRHADRVRAAEAIAAWLPELPGDERAAVVEALGDALAADDEPILRATLADRRVDVRRAAASLLARLPGSELAQLLEARARPLLASQGRLRPSLAVTLPSLDPRLEAAGFGGRPPAGVGERAWLLRQILAHVAPRRWTEWLGVDPGGLVDRALRADEARPVLEGWIGAAQRFGDVGWAKALLAEPAVAGTVNVDVTDVLEPLDAAARAEAVASAAPKLNPAILVTAARACPPPWPKPLVDAALAAIKHDVGTQYPDQAWYELVRATAVGLPPSRADELIALATRDGQVRPALGGVVDTLRLRQRLHDAFRELPPP
jgi:hypothetical protein